MTDHELNLWAARFMGWRELRSESYPSEDEFYAAVGVAMIRTDASHFIAQTTGVDILLAGGGMTGKVWRPMSDPAQAVLLMAEAARKGIVIEPRMIYRSATCGHHEVVAAEGKDAAAADALVSAWCRVVVLAIHDRHQQASARLPEIIHA